MRGEYGLEELPEHHLAELPPRARRIQQRIPAIAPHQGTTSACAENTKRRTTDLFNFRNYLRVRGEYVSDPGTWTSSEELPPRARRIRCPAGVRAPPAGTTSACAENTPPPIPPLPHRRNYLRVRGEYRRLIAESLDAAELPPRARRIRPILAGNFCPFGTTSACAENTGAAAYLIPNPRNYLRVRGEYGFAVGNRAGFLELPPRARRIPLSIRRHG